MMLKERARGRINGAEGEEGEEDAVKNAATISPSPCHTTILYVFLIATGGEG